MRRVVDTVIKKTVNYGKNIDVPAVATKAVELSIGVAVGTFVVTTVKDYCYPPVDWALETHKQLEGVKGQLGEMSDKLEQRDKQLGAMSDKLEQCDKQLEDVAQQLKTVTDLLSQKKDND